MCRCVFPGFRRINRSDPRRAAQQRPGEEGLRYWQDGRGDQGVSDREPALEGVFGTSRRTGPEWVADTVGALGRMRGDSLQRPSPFLPQGHHRLVQGPDWPSQRASRTSVRHSRARPPLSEDRRSSRSDRSRVIRLGSASEMPNWRECRPASFEDPAEGVYGVGPARNRVAD